MSSASDRAAAILELIRKHERTINTILYAISDHAYALLKSLPGCHFCERAATVSHVKEGFQACDRCCAESIFLKKESQLAWIDLTGADEVRRIQAYHDDISALDAVVH